MQDQQNFTGSESLLKQGVHGYGPYDDISAKELKLQSYRL